jgi:hypothetical protein
MEEWWKSPAEPHFKLSPAKIVFYCERTNNLLEDDKMRMTVSILVVLLLASPAVATVIVTCRDLGNWIAEISYDASGEPNLVKAFALDITVDGGATIDSISDYKVGMSTATDPGYGIFPGSIQIVNGEVIDWGTPVADPTYPGTQPGLGTSGITIEMGSLYSGAENAPLVSDTLCKITVNPQGASVVHISIAENIIRGGIVMENPEYIPTVSLVGCTLVPEPATLLLFGLGGLALLRKRKS